jgi:GNAT superfamily N-acetyltransferase
MPADPTQARDFHVDEALRGGRRITIRAIRPDDRERLRQAYRRLSPEAKYLRSFAYKDDLSEAELRRLTEVDFDREVALLATAGKPDNVIAGARYVLDKDGGSAETAFTVLEEYRGLGIAGRLLAHLSGIARARGVKRFTAEVLAENAAMLAVFIRSGLPLARSRDSGVVHLTLDL